MSEWQVWIDYCGHACLTVRADDPQDALEKAMDKVQADDYPGMHIDYDEPELIRDIEDNLERMCETC